MSFDKWVLDATMGYPFCFCPLEIGLEGEHSIVTGVNLIADRPPGKLVAVIHEDGQEAVEAFCVRYKTELAALSSPNREAD